MIKCFKIIASSEFCKGDNNKGWKATFDWIINDTKSCFNRLLEGEFSKNMYEHKLYEAIMKSSDNCNDVVNKTKRGIVKRIIMLHCNFHVNSVTISLTVNNFRI